MSKPGLIRVDRCQSVRCSDSILGASPEAARKQVALMNDPDSRVVFMATEAVLNRGAGKPRDHSNEQDRGRIDLSALTPDERQLMASLLRKAMGMPGA